MGCSHIGALMYDISHLKKLGHTVIPIDPVKTAQPMTWHVPRSNQISGMPVQEVIAHGYNKRRTPMEAPKRTVKSTLYNPVRAAMPGLEDLRTSLQEVSPSSLILPALSSSVHTVQTRFGNFPKGSVLAVQQKLNSDCNVNVYDDFDFPKLPISDKMENCVFVFPLTKEKDMKFRSLQCTEAEIHQYEELTRLQSQSSLWHSLKKNRLGASRMRSVFTRIANYEKLAEDLRKKTRQTSAMLAGLADEPVAAQKYVDIHNYEINIYPIGIVINPWACWIGASPDRKVYNPSRVPPIGILEIKCPRVTSVLEASCLKKVDDKLQLNRNDVYYTQVLTQLAVTGLEWCDFFVWCENDYYLETVYFDSKEWQKVKDKADMFFFKYYL